MGSILELMAEFKECRTALLRFFVCLFVVVVKDIVNIVYYGIAQKCLWLPIRIKKYNINQCLQKSNNFNCP